jgi:hypothetical protein
MNDMRLDQESQIWHDFFLYGWLPIFRVHFKHKRFYWVSKTDYPPTLITPVLSLIKGRLHGAFSMCVFMSDKPFDTEAFDTGGHACETNGLSDMKTHI